MEANLGSLNIGQDKNIVGELQRCDGKECEGHALK